jgi:hypothetical protein
VTWAEVEEAVAEAIYDAYSEACPDIGHYLNYTTATYLAQAAITKIRELRLTAVTCGD